MAILVCRVAWMPGYQSDKESAKGGGRHVKGGWNQENVPHESLNFLPIGDTYYGFVQNRGKNININRLGAKKRDQVSNVSVVFCAENPKSRKFLVTGWYSDATVYRCPFERPEQDPQNRHVYFTATDATLIGKAERRFPIPRTRAGNPFGGIGMHNIWYGLNDAQAETFRQSLFAYMETPSLVQRTPAEVVAEGVFESRERRISERLERKGRSRHFIREKRYKCEACQWEIEEEEVAVWGSSFELHHLTPISELEEGALREVRPQDFAVLCASCHRAIHRTKHVSDVAAFARDYLKWCG